MNKRHGEVHSNYELMEMLMETAHAAAKAVLEHQDLTAHELPHDIAHAPTVNHSSGRRKGDTHPS